MREMRKNNVDYVSMAYELVKWKSNKDEMKVLVISTVEPVNEEQVKKYYISLEICMVE